LSEEEEDEDARTKRLDFLCPGADGNLNDRDKEFATIIGGTGDGGNTATSTIHTTATWRGSCWNRMLVVGVSDVYFALLLRQIFNGAMMPERNGAERSSNGAIVISIATGDWFMLQMPASKVLFFVFVDIMTSNIYIYIYIF